MRKSRSEQASDSFTGLLMVALLVVAFGFGGASRPDVLSPVLVRFVAILAITALAIRRGLGMGQWSMPVIALWSLLLLTPLLQLVPLPWGVWTALPARDYPRELFGLLGLQPWQPLTLVPDRTANAFAALFPAFAAFAIAFRLNERWLRKVWLTVLLIALASGILGLAQLLDGEGSALRFYEITNHDAAVGLFANPNHQGLFLAIALPSILVWVDGYRQPNRPLPRHVTIFAAMASALLAVAALLTFSRAAAAFLLMAAGLTVWLGNVGRLRKLLSFRTVAISVGVVGVAAIVAIYLRAALAAYLGIGQAEGRLENFPKLVAMIADSFPFGTGMGSLDPVFRAYETFDRLSFGYLNNAHNDYLQLLIEAGLPAAVGLALFAMVVVRFLRAAYVAQARSTSVVPQTLCAFSIVLTLLHSLVDYPLRTAALSVIFALSCGALLAYARAKSDYRPGAEPFEGTSNA